MKTKAGSKPLDFTAFVKAFDDGLSVDFRVDADSRGILQIDAIARKVRILWPAAEAGTALQRYKNLRIAKPVNPVEDDMVVLEVDASKSPSAAIALATSIVAALEGGQTALESGVLGVISGWKDILEQFRLLQTPTQVGLMGELLFLIHLVKIIGRTEAIRAWLGPPKSEHDFALQEFEIEVKTTQSEQRIHNVSSETQLTESHGRPLYLLSIQLTQAGASQTGFSLADLVEALRDAAPDHRDVIDSRLEEAGWEDQFAELYSDKFMFRTLPKLFAVDSDFPRITRDVLDQNLQRGNLVTRVNYKIDLSSIQETTSHEFMAGFGENNA